MGSATCNTAVINIPITGVDPPRQPRSKRAPLRYDSKNDSGTTPDRYRQEYYTVIDLIIATVKARFKQKGLKLYQVVEDLVTKPASPKVTE